VAGVWGARWLAALAAMLTVLCAGPSSAAIMILTVQGEASPSGGYAPFAASFPQFGAGQQPAPYSLQYTYDTSLGASGGSSLNSPSPITLARLSILDGTYLLDGFSLSTIGPAGSGMLFYAGLPSGGSYIQSDIVGGFGSGLASPFTLACPQGCGSGVFQLPFNAGALDLTVTAANTVIVPTPAPEPQTWALLLSGFGAIGAMLRRGRPRSLIGA